MSNTGWSSTNCVGTTGKNQWWNQDGIMRSLDLKVNEVTKRQEAGGKTCKTELQRVFSFDPTKLRQSSKIWKQLHDNPLEIVIFT